MNSSVMAIGAAMLPQDRVFDATDPLEPQDQPGYIRR